MDLINLLSSEIKIYSPFKDGDKVKTACNGGVSKYYEHRRIRFARLIATDKTKILMSSEGPVLLVWCKHFQNGASQDWVALPDLAVRTNDRRE